MTDKLSVKAIQEELDAKRDALMEIFDKTKTDDGFQMTPEQIEQVRSLNEELDGLRKKLEEAKQVDSTYQALVREIKEAQRAQVDLPLVGGGEAKQAPLTLGELFVKHPAYAKRGRGRDILADFPDVDMKAMLTKATMATTAGFAPETTRTGRVVGYAVRRPTVADLIPQTTTDQSAIVYMEETTFTNAAAPTAEGGAYPESALAYTERSETVRKISTFIPVTDEQMEDAPQVQSLIDNRLLLMLRLAEEDQLLSGNGTAPNLTGFLNKTGVQAQALGSDPVPDAIYKAMTLVRSGGFAEPTALVIHPNDWQDIRLMRTTDGLYIWGNPSERGPESVWGLPAVITTAIVENTALLGDFALYAELFRKRGVTIKVSDSHADFFTNGKQAIRADERIALAIYRASAFCKVTGI
ncbi:MAG TPA: phage major capsid protein [Chloroflexi bacterium]|nr:phage major capsid protein [Chloroflexota bacterium]